MQISEGEWHHLVITTWPNEPKGYAIYLDKQLTGNLSSARASAVAQALAQPSISPILVTGGQPLHLAGAPIYLCQGWSNGWFATSSPVSKFMWTYHRPYRRLLLAIIVSQMHAALVEYLAMGSSVSDPTFVFVRTAAPAIRSGIS